MPVPQELPNDPRIIVGFDIDGGQTGGTKDVGGSSIAPSAEFFQGLSGVTAEQAWGKVVTDLPATLIAEVEARDVDAIDAARGAVDLLGSSVAHGTSRDWQNVLGLSSELVEVAASDPTILLRRLDEPHALALLQLWNFRVPMGFSEVGDTRLGRDFVNRFSNRSQDRPGELYLHLNNLGLIIYRDYDPEKDFPSRIIEPGLDVLQVVEGEFQRSYEEFVAASQESGIENPVPDYWSWLSSMSGINSLTFRNTGMSDESIRFSIAARAISQIVGTERPRPFDEHQQSPARPLGTRHNENLRLGPQDLRVVSRTAKRSSPRSVESRLAEVTRKFQTRS